MKNYFKKFSIMFIMSLVIVFGSCISAFATDNDYIEGKTNLNNTVENSAEVGKQLTAPEVGWKRYDNNNQKIIYSGNIIKYAPNSNADWYNYTTYDICSDGNAKFKFCGTKIRIFGVMRSDLTTKQGIITIDGIEYPNISEYNSPRIPQALVFEKEDLTDGIHEIEISCRDSLKFSFDAIDVDRSLLPYDESISLDKSSTTLTVGDSQQLTATTTPSTVGVSWKSSDESIATVDTNGKVTAVKEGQATITATTTDGSNLNASCIVTVTPKAVTPTPQPTEETIINTARAKGDNTNNASGSVSIIFKGVAETQLSVVKTADVESVYVGDTFTYTIVVTNTSSKVAKAVVVNDSAPSHIDFNVSGITTTQGKVDSSSTSKNIIVNVGDIPPSGTVTIKVPATVIL